ncbi:UbiA family prenyltransferase [Micromonospora sp. NPDC005254]|uniref:UbiA family prenyltransferase n=1 Tax=Micromonospora sp. NPDC005254 TaxID=3364229 RepID=UPI00369D7708
MTVRHYLRLSRAGLAPFTALPWVVGARGAAEFALLAAGGLLLHAYACKVNDLADLEADRSAPARQTSPLVTGAVTPIRMTWWVLIELLVLAAGCAALPREPWTAAGLLAVLALTTWGNFFQKTSRQVPPLIVDHLFGIAVAAPLVLTGGPVWLALALWLHMVVVNVTVGGIKDLEGDIRAQARTSVRALGVRRMDGRLVLPLRYRAYVILVQTASAAALFPAGPAPFALAVASTAGLVVALHRQPHSGPTPVRRVLRDAGFVVGNTGVFLAGVLAFMPPRWGIPAVAVVVAAFALTAAPLIRAARSRPAARARRAVTAAGAAHAARPGPSKPRSRRDKCR